MLKKVVYAAARSSFVQATEDLHALAEVSVTRERVQRWTKRVGNQRIAEVEAAAEAYAQLPLPARRQSPVAQIPSVACVQMVRSVVATRQGVEAFGARLIAAAHARGFNAARRKAFVADGAASNWGVHKKHFSHYTPILDFTHAVCYVYQAAMASRAAQQGWRDYIQWAQLLWSGNTSELIAAVTARCEELGPPNENAAEGSPQVLVADTLRYLTNQHARMTYAEYRRLGLPITSSHIESTIKQVNRRVKGTEKFWDQGAEPILTLVADQLSETDQLERFWQRRPKKLKTTRCYQSAA